MIEQKNKDLFDRLALKAEMIEEEFGEPFEWQRLDEKRASRIAIYRPGSIGGNEEALKEIRAWTIDHLLKLKKVFPAHLKELW